jgi:hypothetical protein
MEGPVGDNYPVDRLFALSRHHGGSSLFVGSLSDGSAVLLGRSAMQSWMRHDNSRVVVIDTGASPSWITYTFSTSCTQQPNPTPTCAELEALSVTEVGASRPTCKPHPPSNGAGQLRPASSGPSPISSRRRLPAYTSAKSSASPSPTDAFRLYSHTSHKSFTSEKTVRI